jgi:hypothetical protein
VVLAGAGGVQGGWRFKGEVVSEEWETVVTLRLAVVGEACRGNLTAAHALLGLQLCSAVCVQRTYSHVLKVEPQLPMQRPCCDNATVRM